MGGGGDDDHTRPPALPFPDSLCHRCANHRYVNGKATTFVMCTALPVKYPAQPVRHCPAFRPVPLPFGDPRFRPSS